MLFAVSVTQLNLLVDTVIASFLATSSITWLYFSDRMVEFPLGVFGIALSTVILPRLSAHVANQSGDEYQRTLDWALRCVFLVALPAAFGLAWLAGPILATIFQYREFTPYDVEMAGVSLMAYAVGLPAFILIKILATGFFSRQDTRTPVKVGALAMLSNIVLNLLLVGPLQHAGLALATSLSAYLNAGLLYYHLSRHQHFQLRPGWGGYFLKLGIAILVMSLVLYRFVPSLTHWIGWDLAARAGNLVTWVLTGAAAFSLALLATGLRPRDLAGPV